MDRRSFILRNTRLQSPSIVPELRLYLGRHAMTVWGRIAEEAGADDVPPPYWAFAWPGGQAVARYLLDHASIVAGKRVLDFATGSGLCAIAASRSGAAYVLAADIDPYSIDCVDLNSAVNGADVTFTAHDLLDATPPDLDLILAGDILYEALLAKRALPWLRAAHSRGTRVLLGDPGRAYLPHKGLFRLAEYDVPTSRDLEDGELKRAGVFTFAQ